MTFCRPKSTTTSCGLFFADPKSTTGWVSASAEATPTTRSDAIAVAASDAATARSPDAARHVGPVGVAVPAEHATELGTQYGVIGVHLVTSWSSSASSSALAWERVAATVPSLISQIAAMSA